MLSVSHLTVGRSYADVVAGRGLNSTITSNSAENSVPSSLDAPVTSHQNALPITGTDINTNAAPSKSSFASKFKALLYKVAQAPVTFASKVGRALKKTVEQVATWKMFRKVLVRVICVATVIGVSAAVRSMAANPLLGGAIGAMLCAAGQELLGPSADAFVNELFPD